MKKNENNEVYWKTNKKKHGNEEQKCKMIVIMYIPDNQNNKTNYLGKIHICISKLIITFKPLQVECNK